MWEQQVGERIMNLREGRNLTRAQFGDLIGLSAQHVGKIERGSQSITVMTVAKICGATGVSSDYIIFGSINPTAAAEALKGLSSEQIQITLEIAMKVAQFLNTANGNHTLIQEVLCRQHPVTA